MPSLSAHRRAMILNALRKLAAAGAMSAVVRAAVNQSQRTDLTRKARLSVQAMVRRSVFYAAGALLFLIAAGFLVAAIYLGLREAFIAPVAALLTSLLLAAAGGGVLFLGRKKVEQEIEEEAPALDEAEEIEERPPTDVIMEFVQDTIKSAGKNVGLVIAALFLIGLWFGFGREKAVKDEDEEAAASPPRGHDHTDDYAETAPSPMEQSSRVEVNRQRTEVF